MRWRARATKRNGRESAAHEFRAEPDSAARAGRQAFALACDGAGSALVEAEFQRALELDPAHAENLENFGIHLQFGLGDTGRAIEMYLRALDARPGDSLLLTRLAEAEGERGQPEAAEQYWRAALDAEPNNAQTVAQYGAHLLELDDDNRRGERMLQRALQIDPHNPTAHATLGELAEARNDFATADDHFSHASVIPGPERIDMITRYAAFLTDIGAYDRAVEVTNEGLTIDPSSLMLRELRAGLEVHQHRYAPAIELYEAMLDEVSDSAMSQCLYGVACFREGDFSTAERAFRRALECDPDGVDERLHLAHIVGTEHGDWASARALVRRAQQLAPDAPLVWAVSADVSRWAGNVEDAAECWERVTALVPHDAHYLASRADFELAVRGHDSVAVSLLERACEEGLADPDALRTYARLLARLGEDERSQQVLAQAAKAAGKAGRGAGRRRLAWRG